MLLDHTAKRATEPMLGLLGAKGIEPEIALSELEGRQHKGEVDLVRFLNEETGRQEKSLKKGLEEAQEAKQAVETFGREEGGIQRIPLTEQFRLADLLGGKTPKSRRSSKCSGACGSKRYR